MRCSSRSQSFNEWRALPLIKDFTITSVWFTVFYHSLEREDKHAHHFLSHVPFYFTACLFRYNWLSFVYLIYLLLIPLFAEPTKTTMRGESDALQLCVWIPLETDIPVWRLASLFMSWSWVCECSATAGNSWNRENRIHKNFLRIYCLLMFYLKVTLLHFHIIIFSPQDKDLHPSINTGFSLVIMNKCFTALTL